VKFTDSREFLLRPTGLLSERPNLVAESPPGILAHASKVLQVMTVSLQTMSSTFFLRKRLSDVVQKSG